MARLRAVVVVAVVLVLGAWTCQVPTDSPGSGGSPGATVASGVTTPGLTTLLTGEGWHYVGEAGEPAFNSSWGNHTARTMLAFRIRETGVVDIQGQIESAGTSAHIFTLPVGYRPTGSGRIIVASNIGVAWLSISSTGTVTPTDFAGSTFTDLIISGGFNLEPPADAP